MSVSVRIPTTLRPLTGGRAEVEVEGADVRDVIQNLESAHPGLGARLLDEDGNLRKFVNVFVADDDIRFLDGLDTKVPDGAEVSIIPARGRLSARLTRPRRPPPVSTRRLRVLTGMVDWQHSDTTSASPV